jgi:hypothetical protein
MDDGGYKIKEVCGQCKYWDKGNVCGGWAKCSVLYKQERMTASPCDEVDCYETTADFGCCFFEVDYDHKGGLQSG